MGNLNLKLNTQDILGLNSNVKSLKDDIYSLLNDIKLNCVNLNTIVRSNGISNRIERIGEIILDINSTFSSNMDELSQFLEGQMKGYETNTAEATKMLREALSFIETNFVNKAA